MHFLSKLFKWLFRGILLLINFLISSPIRLLLGLIVFIVLWFILWSNDNNSINSKIIDNINITSDVLTLNNTPTKHIILNNMNTVHLFGEINTTTVNFVFSQLQSKSSLPEIYLTLYSPGGSVFAGTQLLDGISGLINTKIHSITLFSASMAFHTVQHTQSRFILPNGILMSHNASGSVSGSMPGSLMTLLKFYLYSIVSLDKFVADRAGMNLLDYYDLIDNDYWCTGSLCIKDKFADELVTVSCDSTLNGTYFYPLNSVITTAGILEVQVELDKCPLVQQIHSIKILINGQDVLKDNDSVNLLNFTILSKIKSLPPDLQLDVLILYQNAVDILKKSFNKQVIRYVNNE